MRRREFITVIGSAAAWPLVARGQQPAKMARIGFVSSSSVASSQQRIACFKDGLSRLGWIDGQTIRNRNAVGLGHFRPTAPSCRRLGAPTARLDRRGGYFVSAPWLRGAA